MRLRYAGECAFCNTPVAAGVEAAWDRTNRRVICLPCLPFASALPEVDPGTPGGSLEREFVRRKQAHEDRVRGRFPRIGGALLALRGEPESTKAFSRGAEGERRLAARLEKLCDGSALFLHNRRRGTSARSGDIDHLAVAASGVYVIDAKHYKGAKVHVHRSGGLFTPAREQLMIRGRDRTHLVESLNKQFVAVSEVLADVSVPVTALFCFVDAELPLFGKLEIRGLPVLGPRGAGSLLRRPGPIGPDWRRELWERLGRALPPA